VGCRRRAPHEHHASAPRRGVLVEPVLHLPDAVHRPSRPGRLRLLPLPALLADVERASDDPPLHLLDLLVGGACDLPPRQRTMRASLDWSYDLLDAATQAVFRRFAVCAGGCTLEAATAVCTGVDATVEPAARIDDTFGRLNVLVDNYVLTMDHGGGESRLTLPPLAQAYALCRLRDSREEEAARRRHARYFLSIVEAADEPHAGQGRAMWPARLTREADNLSAAARWAAMAGETASAHRLTDALCGASADACRAAG